MAGESGPMLLEAISKGLSELGREVVNFGVAATPTTGVLIKQTEIAGRGDSNFGQPQSGAIEWAEIVFGRRASDSGGCRRKSDGTLSSQ